MEWRDTKYDRLIDSIYDAGACPELWPGVLSAIGAGAGAEGGVIFGFSRSRGLVFEHIGALDPHSATVFKTRHANNVWVQGMASRPQNRLVISDSLIGARKLMRTDFYDEVLKPQRLVHGALARLTAGADIDIQFSVEKSVKRGPFTAAQETFVRRLVPHVRRALGVSLRLRSDVPMAGGACSITDCLNCPALTLNRCGGLAEANGAAQRLAASGMLPLSRSGLTFSDPSEHRRYVAALKDACAGAAMRSLVLTQGTSRFEVVCMAFHPHLSTGSGASGRPASALLLINPLPVQSAAATDLRRSTAGHLTPAERRVATVAASGVSNGEIASILGVSLNTVKTHLRRVYAKLDVRRQSELVIRLSPVPPAPESSEYPTRSHPFG